MRKITLSEIFNKRNACRVLAVVLALTMLMAFAGCDKKGKDKDNSSVNNSSIASSQTESTDSSTDANSSDLASSEVDNTSSLPSDSNTDVTSSDDMNLDNTPSDTSSTDDTSSDATSSVVSSKEEKPADTSSTDNNKPTSSGTTSINPLYGDIRVSYDYSTTKEFDDEDEIALVKDPSNLVNKYVGYAEDERNKLQQEILNSI